MSDTLDHHLTFRDAPFFSDTGLGVAVIDGQLESVA